MNRPYPFYDQCPEYKTVKEFLISRAMRFNDTAALSYRDKASDTEKHTVTYRELADVVRAAGTEMAVRGMDKTRCAIIGKLTFPWTVAYLSVLSIGGVLVPLDPEWSAEDLGEAAKSAGATVLIIDNDRADKIETICKIAGISSVIYTHEGLGEMMGDLIADGQTKVEAGERIFDRLNADPEEMSLLVFTSGTTGQGKGVMLSQHALLSNIFGAQKIALLGTKTIAVLPPHHTFGSTIGILAPLSVGCEIYISNGLRAFPRELQQEKPDNLILVPLFLETFAAKIRASVKKEGKEKLFNSMLRVSNGLRKTGINATQKMFASVLSAFGGNLKQVICGGAPMNRDAYELFTSLGLCVLNGYGITECSPLISVNRPKHNIPGSVGMPLPNIEVKIDGEGDEGEGEICVKGANVMLGYYQNESATADVIDSDGFFHTGDIGKIDPKSGYIYITGRSKNLIILSNGKNVYPEEIEGELASIPGVAEVVVYEGQSRKGTANNRIVAEFFMDEEFVEKESITDAKDYLCQFVNKYNKSAVTYKRVGLLRVRTTEFPKNTLKKIIRFKIDKNID